MIGKWLGVSTQIFAEQPKAMTTYCQMHSLSLEIKLFTKDCRILLDAMGTAGQIRALVK